MNPFDQFDAAQAAGGISANPFDQFDEGAPGPARRAANDIGLKLNTGTTVSIPEQAIGINDLLRKGTPLGVIGSALTPKFLKDARDSVEDSARGALDDRRKALTAELTPEQQAADQKPFFTEEMAWSNLAKDGIAGVPGKVVDLVGKGNAFGEGWSDWRKVTGATAESLPSTLVTMGPTAKIAGAAGKRALAETLAKTGSESAARAAALKSAQNTAMVVGGAAEGLQGAGAANEQTRRTVMEMPTDTLAQSEFFRAELERNGGDEVAARRAAADAAATTSAGVAFLFDATLGAIGDRYIGTAAAGGGTRAGAVLRGTAQETPTELAQSGGEKFGENLGIQRFADPTQALMQDVGEEAVGGALSGGLMGATMGGVFHRNAGPASGVNPPPQLPNAGPLSRSANVALATQAADVLGAPVDSMPGAQAAAQNEPVQVAPVQSVAETAVTNIAAQPASLTAPDRVSAIDGRLGQIQVAGSGAPQDIAEMTALQAERDSITRAWPKAAMGAQTEFSTESGARLKARYAIMSAREVNTSHDENLKPSSAYPAELQPRERDRAASEMQISSIAQRLDPARLGESADAATGAPIVGPDGLTESGNARTIALKRVYRGNAQKAGEYKQYLRDNAAKFGLTPDAIDGVDDPVLVRVRETPVDRAEFARQANASTVAQMSPREQARSDAARIDVLDDLRPTEEGDFAASHEFIRRFVSKLPGTEQAGMIDAGGKLSQSGYARVRNAVLAKAYGDSPVLTRMIESMDDNLRNVGKALMTAAPTVAKMRQDIKDGALYDADITTDLIEAVETLSRLKDEGKSVADEIAQMGMFADGLSEETRELLAFLDQNIRRPRKIAEFIQAYADALRAAGNPNQGSLLGETQEPGKSQIVTAIKGAINAEQQARQEAATEPAAKARAGAGVVTAEASGGREGAAVDEAGRQEWVAFGDDSGTLGIPRNEMPQVKGSDRGALINFLKARGIDGESDTVAPGTLKPTQAEFSRDKVAKFVETGAVGARSVLVSSDGHVLDGHHQWLGHRALNEDIPVIRLSAPIRELLDVVNEFPSVRRAGGADADARAAAVSDFKAAMADLADIASRRSRVAMMPENLPGLMPTLVKLFDAAIRLVGTDIKATTKWVKEQLKLNPDTRAIWNKIDASIYQKAALQAAENPSQPDQLSLFDTPDAASEAIKAGETMDLFSQPAPTPRPAAAAKPAPAPAPKKRTMVIDGVEYDADAPNFGLPPAPLTLKAGDPLLVETDKKPLDSTVLVRSVVAPDGVEMTRAEMHQAIEDYHFRNAVQAPAGRKPVAYVMGGGGASGKGTIKRQLRAEGLVDGSDTVGLDPDEIKEMIAEYQQIIDAGDSRAAAIVHEESSALSKRIKARAIAGRFDMVLDVTLGDKAKGIKALQELKDAGYEVRLFGVTIKPEAAVIRAGLRAAGSKRYVPYDALLHAHKGFAGAWESYAEMVDVAVLYENTDGRRKLAEKVDGKLVLHDEQAYNEFAERRNVNEKAESLGSIGGPAEGRGRAAGQDRRQEAIAGGTQGTGSPGRRDQSGERGASARVDGAEQGPGGVNEQRLEDGARGDAGQEPGALQKPVGKRKAVSGRDGNIAELDLTDRDAPARDRTGARAERQDAADGNGKNPADGRRNGARRGVRKSGISDGRDIPVKTGRNYAFGDTDLTYEGGWLAKATQNVEALELLKSIEKEGRQATAPEQSVLAKFIGWGASDLANSIFGDKLDKQLAAIEQYERAIEGFDRIGRDSLTQRDTAFYAAYTILKAKTPELRGYYDVGTITRDMVEKAKPDMGAKRWAALRDRARAAMTPDEWKEASRSTQYAHYTSKPIVQAMWSAMERMGFKGGAILEPGAGIGVFPGLMPQAMANNSTYTGIEFDGITGGILKQLFPDERILVESFVDSALPDNFYDVAAGNPPFHNTPILADPRYKKHAFALHDYFFAKSIDRVKPGGLVMFVTSRYTMDKLNDKARAYLSDRADLVGAIRLPQTAFKKNAGTDVVTDVLFLRKKVEGETFDKAQAWAKSVPMAVGAKSFPVNEYFHAHPEMVLGTPSDTGKMNNSPEPQYTVLSPAGDIEALFAKAAATLPENIYKVERGSSAEAAAVREIDFNPKAQKEGNYYVTAAGVLMQREGGVGVRADGVAQDDVAMLKDFVSLRDALKQAHYDQLNDGDWQASLGALQKAYAGFVKLHGKINQFTEMTRKLKAVDPDTGEATTDERTYRKYPLIEKMADDPDYSLVMALETLNDETGEISESAFLKDRVLGKPERPTISTQSDALLSVLNDLGHVDMAEAADRMGMSEQEMIDALGTMVFNDPSSGWVMADEYLSGNVKKKLAEAREAAKSDRKFERNVEALIDAQPTPVTPADITIAIGMNWIEPKIYEQFLKEKAGVVAKVTYNERTGQWDVSAEHKSRSTAATEDWGTSRRPAEDILLAALTGAPIRITETQRNSDGTSKTVFLPDATEAANQKLTQMREAFASWVWEDSARSNELAKTYNDKFNTIVPRKFDGRHLTLPGVSKKWSVFPHVKRGAWRIIQSGNTYLAHAVGSGKTFEMIIAAMEQKRLGLIKKPMMVVPNHMLQQFAREWIDLYPAARLMVADEKNFHTENRRRFVSRVAMSDLDGVIITHSAFKILDLDPAFKQEMIEKELDYLRAALEEADPGYDGNATGKKKSRDPKVKQIEGKIEKMEQKLESAMSGAGKDTNVRFDELGVDQLFVDEAHEFRKLSFTTQRQVKGIDSSGSERAFDLYMKTRWLERKKPGRSLVMASGTPVTNTLAEIYTVQRFMAPAVLEERGLEEFDAWAAMFGQDRTAIEADASGKYAPVTRFSKFVNVPELTQMFREFADVLTSDHLAEMLGDKRPKVNGGSRKIMITPQTDDYAAFKKELADRLEVSSRWKPSKEEPYNPDPVIRIIGDGRLAAIDMRFIDPSLPSNPDSKLNRVADDVIRIFKETSDYEYKAKDGSVEPIKGATQIVFSDLGFGAGVTEKRGFNARAWFEKRLRDAGIPPAQVAFMTDHKKSTAKLKLFKDINAGRVRVVVGSSKNMGTGVNAQQRLIALHHIDTPWFPADLEQREGRIIRQGNKNPVVDVLAFSTKGSYDAVMWQMLSSKQRFIDQAMSGDTSVRSIDDLSEASQFEIATAMTSDDERAIQLAGIRADVERLNRLYRAHEESRAKMRQEYDWAGRTIDLNEKLLPAAIDVAAKVKDLSGDAFTAKADGKSFDVRKEWGEALLSGFKAYSDTLQTKPAKIGEISGFDVVARGFTHQGNGYRAQIEIAIDANEDVQAITESASADPVGVALRAANIVSGLSRRPAVMRQHIEEATAKRQAIESRLEAPFQFAEMLADKRREASDLEAAMMADQGKLTGLAREQELEDLWQAKTGAITPMFSRANAIPETITIDGVERPTRNSKGQYIHPTEEGIRNFWKWFGDSKAVDAEGRPLVVYHGTPTGGFTEFSAEKQGSKGGRSRGGFSFTTNRAAAEQYANGFSAESNAIDAIIEKANAVLSRATPTAEMLRAGMAEEDTGINEIDWQGIDSMDDLDDLIDYIADMLDKDGQVDSATALRDARTAKADGAAQVYEVYLRVPVGAKEFFATPETIGREVKDLDVRTLSARSAIVRMPGERVFYVADSSQIKSAAGNTGDFNPENPSINFSRGIGAGMAVRDLSAVVDRVSQRLKNLPAVHVLKSPADLSKKDKSQRTLRDFIRKAGAWDDVEGATHDGEIYLFASGLADEYRAEHVLAVHEATHYGLRGAIGKDLDAALQQVWTTNARVRKAAAALRVRNGLQSNIEATEEVLAEMPAAELVKLSGWRRVVKSVRDWLSRSGFKRMAERLDALMKAGMNDQERADVMVAELVTAAREWVRTGAGRPFMNGTLLADSGRVRLSRNSRPESRRTTGFDKASGTVVADFKNDNLLKAHRNYRAAKGGDIDAAMRLVQDLVKTESLNAAKAFGNDVIYTPVHAEEASGRNKIPLALAAHYAASAGGELGVGIVQTNRAYHTGANAMERLLVRAEFGGQIEAGKRYVLVDDVTTMGGTLADMANYIRSQGGEVVGSVLLVNATRSGIMTPASRTIKELEVRHGKEISSLFSIEPGALTWSEAQYLIGFRTTDELRNRVAAARSERSARLLAKGISEPEGSSGGVTPRLSRSNLAQQAPQSTAAKRAEEMIMTPAGAWRPVDAVMKYVTTKTRIASLTSAIYDRAGALINRYTPEDIKAGVVADYGIPEAVLDRRSLMQGQMRVQLRKSGALIEKLSTLTRAESRVAYEWMNNADPQAQAYFESQLPEESVKVMEEIKALIDSMSKEAVRLGQLSPEAFERNRFAYLRRSYVKHTMDLTKGETKSRQRAISVLGDQYKGRGMTDAIDMAKFKNIAPEWWGRKLKDGQADKQLKGEKFIRLEHRAPVGEGTMPLEVAQGPGNPNPQKKGRLLEVAYWPASEAIPSRYAAWDHAGTWEVRDTKGGKLVVWRDFTKQERITMGEIDEARYAIAKSLQGMIHDVETGRYLEWLATTYAKKGGEQIDGEIVEASERMRDVFKPGEWVQVPETKIQGTSVLKYGLLAGRYLPGPIWNDVRQSVGFRFRPLGETYAAILSAWKTSKTALSPAVHTNNVMANFVMADWHDVSTRHILKALRIILGASQRDGKGLIGRAGNAVSRAGIVDADAAREIISRYQESGANLGSWVTAELQREQMQPLLEAIEHELGIAGQTPGAQVGVFVALQKALQLRFPSAWDAFKPTLPGRVISTEARNMIDLYEAEDQVFRLAAWLRAKEEGAADPVAGKIARRSFLDYHINAPWIQAMRNTALPFISFTYRAVPMLIEVAAKKPHKIMKLGLMAAALNALGYMLSGGDEDEERRLLPEEKAGAIWGMVPKLIRMPWNDANSEPVFLDIRRFVPVGDVFDVGQTHSALPLLPFAVPGGPLALMSELMANKSQFTGREIALETDTPMERATKVADHLYKAFAPNIVLLPGTYAFTGVTNAATGKTDAFGREQSTVQALASSFGLKLGSYPADVLQSNTMRAATAKLMEIDRNISQAKREYQRNGIDDAEFQSRVEAQNAKKLKIIEELQKKMGG